ncbi:hypothetical protein ABTM48_21510, partial [Acinetobacter baumannii]
NIQYRAMLGEYLSRAGYPVEAGKIFSAVKIDDDIDPLMLMMIAQYKTRSADANGARLLLDRFANRADLKNNSWFQS